MKQEMPLILDTSHCAVTRAFLPTFFLPFVFRWALMFFSKGFLGMWNQLTLDQIRMSFCGLWLGHMPGLVLQPNSLNLQHQIPACAGNLPTSSKN